MLGTKRWCFPTAAKSGQIYEASFKLSKVFKVTDALSIFEYSFQVMPQNFELSVENIKPYVKTELSRQKIEGLILTADYAENKSVEKILVAKQDEKYLKLSWSHTADGKQHLFTVEDVARIDNASKVTLSIDGKSLPRRKLV